MPATSERKAVAFAALAVNLLIVAAKLAAGFLTGSSVMISEAIHSTVDSGNQRLTILGMARAKRPSNISGFERIWRLYCFDRAKPATLEVVPYLDTRSHGVFATRAPARPNPIGLSCVKLLAVEGNRLQISQVDILDGTPLLDIKPYVPDFDAFDAERVGWYAHAKGSGSADERFAAEEVNFYERVRQLRALRENECVHRAIRRLFAQQIIVLQSSFLFPKLMFSWARVDNPIPEGTASRLVRIVAQERQRKAMRRYGASDGYAKKKSFVGNIRT